METLLVGIAALACPVGMGAMMWFMAKGMRSDRDGARERSIDELRAEHARLGGEIERLDAGSAPAEASERTR